MHDLAPIHMAKTVENYLQNEQKIALMNWPPKGAHLNVIENIWALLQFGVLKFIRQYGIPKNSADLWAVIQVICEQLKQANNENALYDFLPRRITQIIQSNGY